MLIQRSMLNVRACLKPYLNSGKKKKVDKTACVDSLARDTVAMINDAENLLGLGRETHL